MSRYIHGEALLQVLKIHRLIPKRDPLKALRNQNLHILLVHFRQLVHENILLELVLAVELLLHVLLEPFALEVPKVESNVLAEERNLNLLAIFIIVTLRFALTFLALLLLLRLVFLFSLESRPLLLNLLLLHEEPHLVRHQFVY